MLKSIYRVLSLYDGSGHILMGKWIFITISLEELKNGHQGAKYGPRTEVKIGDIATIRNFTGVSV